MRYTGNIPVICIVGRPNVGKSSLFNCLLGERRAVVVEQSGTTRDRLESIVKFASASVKLVDTGGYAVEDKDDMSMLVKDQIYSAMEEATVVLLVMDTISGITPADEEMASLLRKSNKPVVLVANKTDNDRLNNDAMEFYQFGFGEPSPVSCLHTSGIRALKKRIVDNIDKRDRSEYDHSTRHLKIAVVGRPNVGKSSFINNILARKRVIVSPIPGTTRDSIDTHFRYEDDDYILIDTAGIRHRRKVKTVVDTFSMMRSREAIKRADVALLLLDAADGVTRDDIGILKFIEESGKACLVLVNKWDLAKEAEDDVSIEDYEKHLLYASNELSKFPITFISSLTGKNVADTLSLVKVLDSNLDIKASTPFLNRIFDRDDPAVVPIPRRKSRPNFLYIIQSSVRPVEFKYFVNDPGKVLPAHMSFIENKLRANLPLKGIPVKINIRKSKKSESKRKKGAGS